MKKRVKIELGILSVIFMLVLCGIWVSAWYLSAKFFTSAMALFFTTAFGQKIVDWKD